MQKTYTAGENVEERLIAHANIAGLLRVSESLTEMLEFRNHSCGHPKRHCMAMGCTSLQL